MTWNENWIRDALTKYTLRERNLQEKIFECERKRLKIEYERGNKTSILLTNRDDSRARNEKLLKDLERTKARLRTAASFTPTDRELDDRSLIYKHSLAIKSRDDAEAAS